MSLEWLDIQRVRNISHTHLNLSPGINLIYGANASGKTSLLESVYFLASSRSFRSHSTHAMIQQGEQDCLVLGRGSRQGQPYRLGVQRDREGARDIRINGTVAVRTTDLVRVMPTLQLGPETIELIPGPPALRRRFLNWGVFHVEQDFTALWEEAGRSLRQRNLALRSGVAGRLELEAWTAQLVRCAEKLDRARANYVAEYEPVFQAVVAELSGLKEVRFDYYRGWAAGVALADIYAEELLDDQKRGHTSKGFQRADVRMRIAGQPAAAVCSRGELKSLAWSMVLAQGALARGEHPLAGMLYLIDDLASEFDLEHRRRVVQFLHGTGNQVLLTGVDKAVLIEACHGVEESMFHVKQGKVEES